MVKSVISMDERSPGSRRERKPNDQMPPLPTDPNVRIGKLDNGLTYYIRHMDGSLIDDKDKNPDGLDLIVTDSRIDLLENKVTLAVPEGNPKGIESFDQLAELLKSGDVMLAIGNSDVPVGQYTQKIFAYYGLDESAMTDCLTYGNNVKEVTTQVSEASADCGIIYATDAYSAGLTVVDSATAEMCGQVIYPAAVLKGEKEEAAQAFLDYLQTADAMEVFKSVGFSPAN